MTYSFDFFKEGQVILCSQCQKVQTIQFDNRAPQGWFVVFDHKEQGKPFCSAGCISHFLSAHGRTKPEVIPTRKSWVGGV